MCICANVSLYCETGECKEYMKRYMKCLRENNNGNHLCRTESKDYLQCRMDRYICFPIFIPVKDLFLNSFWKGEPKNEMILADELQIGEISGTFQKIQALMGIQAIPPRYHRGFLITQLVLAETIHCIQASLHNMWLLLVHAAVWKWFCCCYSSWLALICSSFS